MRFAWQRKPQCRICGAPMKLDIVTYSAPDAEGRPRRYENVCRYSCPNGCPTGYYDFRRAYTHKPDATGRAGRRERRQRAAWAITSLLVAFGIVGLYALFMYAVGAMPIGAYWVRVTLWAVTTLAFLGIGALAFVTPRRGAPAGSATAPASQAASALEPAPANRPASGGSSPQKKEADGAERAVKATGKAAGA